MRKKRGWIWIIGGAVVLICICVIIGSILLLQQAGEPSEGNENTQAAQNSSSEAAAAVETITPETVKSGTLSEDIIAQANAVITLADDGSSYTGSGVTVDGGQITITEAGTYVVSGLLTEGQLVVDTEDEKKVEIYLNGVEISNTDAALRVYTSPKKTVLYLVEDSINILSDTRTETVSSTDSETAQASTSDTDTSGAENGTEQDIANAAVYSQDDLTIKGAGVLYVISVANKGIVSKDDIDIEGGVLYVSAAADGIQGRDAVNVLAGTITVSAGEDGIRTTNEEKGEVVISGGTIVISSGNDGIQAETDLTISGGDITITAGGGSENSTASGGFDDFGGGFDGGFGGFGGGFGGDMDRQDINDFGGFGGKQDGNMDGKLNGAGGKDGLTPEDGGAEMPSDEAGGEIGNPPDGLEDEMGTMPDFGDELPDGQADSIMPEAGKFGMGIFPEDGNGTENTEGTESDSRKAIKAGSSIQITGGSFSLNASDDTLHCNGDITISGGTLAMASGDDGIHADGTLTIAGGTIEISESYEGLEALIIMLNGGTIYVTASDDGLNATDGSGIDAVGGGGFGRGGFGIGDAGNTAAETDICIYISGDCYLVVDADGDGIDSNGNVVMSGGTVLVYGPTDGADGALDYAGSFTMSGGVLLACGSSGMAQSVTAEGDTGVLYCSAGQIAAGTLVHIEDTDGNEIITFVSEKTFQSIVYCAETLEAGSTYTIYTGGSCDGTLTDGVYQGGSYSGGTRLTEGTAQ